jgi:hypothetical protein
MELLDEAVGAEHWQRRHYIVGENLHCEVSIWVDGIGWVAKSDVGTESNTEKEKGEASDSFKRACVNWGIGRELYTAKDLRVKNDKIEWYDKGGDKKGTYDTFHVAEIAYDNYRNISAIAIANQRGIILYSKGSKAKSDEQKQQERTEKKIEKGLKEDALITEYKTKVERLMGAGTDAQAYFIKKHGINLYDASPNALKQAIASIDKKIKEADPTT